MWRKTYPLPSKKSQFDAHNTVIVGNVSFYGATGGEAYIYGVAGERFCVRNSGAKVVVSGVGDHGCEYMTGGVAVILGEIGKNFGAGMSGGIAYIYDRADNLSSRINPEMVELEQMSDEESREIRGMIERYIKYTGSKEAEKILENWEANRAKFIKVMPTDYKRVLEEIKEVEEV